MKKATKRIDKIIDGLIESEIFETSRHTHVLSYEFPKEGPIPDDHTIQFICHLIGTALENKDFDFLFSVEALEPTEQHGLAFVVTLDGEELESNDVKLHSAAKGGPDSFNDGLLENRAALMKSFLREIKPEVCSEYRKFCLLHSISDFGVSENDRTQLKINECLKALYNEIRCGVADANKKIASDPIIHVKLHELPGISDETLNDDELHYLIERLNTIMATVMDSHPPENCPCRISEIVDYSDRLEGKGKLNVPGDHITALTFPNAEDAAKVLDDFNLHQSRFNLHIKELTLGENLAQSNRTH